MKRSVYVFASAVFLCSSISQKAQELLNVAMSNLPRL